jgi:hypothetical protein
MKPRVLYVWRATSRECEGWWSDLFHRSHLLVRLLTCLLRALSVWKTYEGWHALFKINMSWGVMSPHFAIRVHSAWRICKDTLHSNGGYLRLDPVHAATWCMDTVSIVNGNVCGHFHDMLAWKVLFCGYSNHVSTIAKRRVAPSSYYRESGL